MENNNKNTSKVSAVILKLLEDKEAMNECIRKKGDIHNVAAERNVTFATPI